MDNQDVKVLVESFHAYRDMINPIQQSLVDFIETYDLMKDNIEKLNDAFDGGVKQKLEYIYNSLSGQAAKAADLSSRIEQFVTASNQYNSSISKVIAMFSKIEERLKSVNELESKAEGQIGRLDEIIEEKSKSYNIKELQKTLDGYNTNVMRVAEFINKDVAQSLEQNREKIGKISGDFNDLLKSQQSDSANIEALLESHRNSGNLLKKITEQGDVNESYIFDILDKWAAERKIKMKKD